MQLVADFGRVIRYLAVCAIRRWYIVGGTMVLFVGLAIGLGRISLPVYSSSMIIVPQQQSPLGALGGRMSQLASLSSSLSSFGLGGIGGSQTFQTYQEVLQSPSVAAAILANPEVLSGLYYGLTDPKTGKYINGAGRLTTAMYALFGLQAPDGPDVDDVAERLNKILVVETAADNLNVATIHCISPDPDFCPKFLLFVDNATQTQLSAVSLADSTRMVKYINEQLPHIQQQEVRDALSDLLAASIKQIAISRLHQTQGAMIVSAPYASSRPSFPRPGLLIKLALALGFVAGVFAAWFFTQTEYDVRVSRRLLAIGGRRGNSA